MLLLRSGGFISGLCALFIVAGPVAAKPNMQVLPAIEQASWSGTDDRGVNFRVIRSDKKPALLRIEMLSESTVRIRVQASGDFQPTLQERDGLINTSFLQPNFTVDREDESVSIISKKINVHLVLNPLHITFSDGSRVLTQTPVGSGLRLGDDRAALTMESPDGERFYGFGDQGPGSNADTTPDKGLHRAPLDHRGQWIFMAGLSCHRNYYLPFFMSSRGYGFFLNTLTLSHWDMAKTNPAAYHIMTEDSRLDFIVIAGPALRDILRDYTALAGRPPLLPRWVLGTRVSAKTFSLQDEQGGARPPDSSRWFDQNLIESEIRTIREQHEPADYYHMDSAWQTQRNSFEWVPQIHDPAGLLKRLAALHFKIGLWQRPTPAVGTYPLYQEALQRDYFVKNSDGSVFVATHKWGGASSLVDFTNPEAVAWWQKKVRALTELGARLYKLDSESTGIAKVYPEGFDLQFHNGMTGREMDNYYGPLYIKTVWDAHRAALHGERAVLQIMHATYFSGGRYPYMGLGDRAWAHPAAKIRYAVNYGLSGVPFWDGSGYGAFGIPTADSLYNLQLQPYTYTYWREAHETGIPVVRGLALEYQDDQIACTVDDAYLFGEHLLVAPYLGGEGPMRRVYLPPGEWTHQRSNVKHLGPGWMDCPVSESRPAVFVRGGAIIPQGPFKEYVEQSPDDPLTLHVYPKGTSEFTLYEDDNHTYAYESGAFSRTTFRCVEGSAGITVSLGAAAGQFDGMLPKRAYHLTVYGTTVPSAITFDGTPLKQYANPTDWETATTGWCRKEYEVSTASDRRIYIKLPATSTNVEHDIALEKAAPHHYYGF